MSKKRSWFYAAFVMLAATSASLGGDESLRLWPVQKRPAGLVSLSVSQCAPPGVVGMKQDQHLILAQSLVGLAAQSVNQARFNEMVYLVESGNPHYDLWRGMLLERTGIEDLGESTLWSLIERYKDLDVFDGYVLYRRDASEGPTHTVRKGSDRSVNVATSLSGILRALVVSEELQEYAEKAGLTCLLDARDKTEAWAFETYKDQFNPGGVLLQDPRLWQARDVAIANRYFCAYGLSDPVERVYEWMQKPGLVFGWNDGRYEGESVLQLCELGHVISASDWALNLSAHSIESPSFRPAPFQPVDGPADVSTQRRPMVTFAISDGDNLQWMLRDFALNTNYWAAPEHGRFPLAWGLPVIDLLETGVDTYQYLQRTKPDSSSVFMMTEYFFPDRYAIRLDETRRRELLARLGRRAEHAMQVSGVKILGFLVMDLDSQATVDGLEAMASTMPSLEAVLAWAYHPYEAGDGKVLWIQGANGKIPVITCAFSIWAQSNRPGAGTPAKISRILNERYRSEKEQLNIWGIVHAWSGFKPSAELDEQAENGVFLAPGTRAAVAPTKWCIERLDPAIKVVPLETLVERTIAEAVENRIPRD